MLFLGPLVLRLRDADYEVRLAALKHLTEIGLTNPEMLSVETFKELGGRVKDKKSEIRKLALVGLSRLYYKHISSTLPALNSLHCCNDNSKTSSNTSTSQSDNSGDNSQSTNESGKMQPLSRTTNAQKKQSLLNIIKSDNAIKEFGEMYGVFANFLRKDIVDRLSFIPSYLVNSWGYAELHHLILQVTYHI